MKQATISLCLLLFLLTSTSLLADPPGSSGTELGAEDDERAVFHFKEWPIEAGGNGHFYGIIDAELTWEEASSAAKSVFEFEVDGYLATITSFEENQFIFDEIIGLLNQSSYLDQYWLGGLYDTIDGTWGWATGESFIFEHWAPYEPNNIGIENALAMWGPRNYFDFRRPGRWNNATINDEINQYARNWAIVEWGPLDTTTVAPEPDTLINLVQWTTADGGNDHWYAIISLEKYQYEMKEIASALEQDGMIGYLATITSETEDQFILNNVVAGVSQPSLLDAYWLGGHDAGGEWVWDTGEEFGYTNWAFGEPNNEGVETAVCMWGWDSWKYNRQPGSWNNSLPDPTVNPLAQWYAIVEWGEPDMNPYIPDTLAHLRQWKKANGGNDHWYAILAIDGYADQATAIAPSFLHDDEPGYLATVTSIEENDFIFDSVIRLMNQSNYEDRYWLGGTYVDGVPTWNTGENFVFEYWAAYQPDDYAGYSAIAMFGANNWFEFERPRMWCTAAASADVSTRHHWYALIEWGELDTVTVLPEPDSIINLVQWPLSEGGNDHWYAVMTTTEYWVEADARAHTLEQDGLMGYLATVTSVEENQFILDHVIAGTNQASIMDAFWMGGFEVDLIWQWITGEPFSYTNWAYYEPNNIGIENVLMMWGPNSWKWNRQPGTWNNSLPDSTINQLAQWWSIVEWGDPNSSSTVVYDGMPNSYGLEQNYPNPFNPTTQVAFSLPSAQPVKLEIFNIRGQLVTTLVDGYVEAGHHEVEWDSKDYTGEPVASGVYLYRVKAGDYTDTKKMVLVR